MSTEAKRTTIYLPQELLQRLDKAKQEKFYKDSQSAMIGHFIRLGMIADEQEAQKHETVNSV